MSQPQLRLAAPAVFDTVRGFFANGALTPGERLDGTVPAEVAKALRELGIVDGKGVAQWDIALVDGFLLAYSGDAPPAEESLTQLIPTTFDRVLVLKAGAGHTALAASRRTGSVVAVESSPRLRQMLEFHLRLNGISNVTVRPGAEERVRYPMILAANLEQESLEATLRPAGGGEKRQIRMLNKAVSYLGPGGRLLANVTVSLRAAEKMETQVREWLPAAAQCGLVLYETRAWTTVDFAIAMLRGSAASGVTLEDCLDKLEKADSKSVADGVMMVHDSGTPYFGHSKLAHPIDAGAIQRSWRWGEDEDLILSPRLGANWRIREPFRMEGGTFQAQRESMVTDAPFEAEFPFPPWLKTLLTLVDGQRTLEEIVDSLGQHGVSRADALFGLKRLGNLEVIRVD